MHTQLVLMGGNIGVLYWSNIGTISAELNSGCYVVFVLCFQLMYSALLATFQAPLQQGLAHILLQRWLTL